MWILNYYRKKAFLKEQADNLYLWAVQQTRSKDWYESLKVPDTLDGRFDLLSIFMGLLIGRLQEFGTTDMNKLAQYSFDRMFIAMEATCREIGIGDLSIPRNVKAMMTAFKGRAMRYQQICSQKNRQELAQALQKNIYGDTAQNAALNQTIDLMVDDVFALYDFYQKLSQDQFLEAPISTFLNDHYKRGLQNVAA
jgi:cytochrome b pre-mRNA-processing protein 3